MARSNHLTIATAYGRIYPDRKWPIGSAHGAGTMAPTQQDIETALKQFQAELDVLSEMTKPKYTVSWEIKGNWGEQEISDSAKAHMLFDIQVMSGDTDRVFLSDGTKQLAAWTLAGGLIAWSDELQMMVSIPND